MKAGEVPEEIKDVFQRYSTNGTMSVEELHKFMVGYQGESGATKEEAQIIYDSVKHLSLFLRRGLHLDAFFRYLLGDINGPLRMVGILLSSFSILFYLSQFSHSSVTN